MRSSVVVVCWVACITVVHVRHAGYRRQADQAGIACLHTGQSLVVGGGVTTFITIVVILILEQAELYQ